MKTRITAFFRSLVSLLGEEWDAKDDCFEVLSFKRDENILQADHECDYIGFFDEGKVWFYHFKAREEKFLALWFLGEFLSNGLSFLYRKPSTHYCHALSDKNYLRLKIDKLSGLYDSFKIICRLGFIMAMSLYITVDEQLDRLLQ